MAAEDEILRDVALQRRGCTVVLEVARVQQGLGLSVVPQTSQIIEHKLSNSIDSSNENCKREQFIMHHSMVNPYSFTNGLIVSSHNSINGSCKVFDVVRVQPRLNEDVRPCNK